MSSRLITWSMVLFFCLTIVSCFLPAQDRARLEEINRIWSAFPLYTGMVEANNSTASGFGKAFVSKSFRCKASYEDVKRFYVERLSQDRWQLAGERQLKDWNRDLGGRELKFRRGDYVVTIEYAGEKADHGWDYGIGIGWH